MLVWIFVVLAIAYTLAAQPDMLTYGTRQDFVHLHHVYEVQFVIVMPGLAAIPCNTIYKYRGTNWSSSSTNYYY